MEIRDDTALTLTMGAMGLAAQFYSSALPERATVTSWASDPGHRSTVGTQCAQSGIASLAVGIGASVLSRSWWPLLGVAVVVAYLSGTFMHAASRPGDTDTPPAGRPVSSTPAGYRWIS